MIGVIADDLTGAAEIAGLGWRAGLHAEVLLADVAPDVRRRTANEEEQIRLLTSAAAGDLVCVDTDSRFCSTDEASRRATSAVENLRRAGATWIYKKVDSVLRGNVTAEIEAVMRAFDAKTALLVPANPSLGRVIRDGRYFVRGRPIEETEFARDPAHPRTSSRVLDLIAAPQSCGIRVARVGEEFLPGGIVVGEVGSGEDVSYWASRRSEDVLAAGGAEFFAAMVRSAVEQGTPRTPTSQPGAHGVPRLTGPELFICGSTSDATRDFLDAERRRGTAVFALPAELAGGGEFHDATAEVLATRVASALESAARVVLCIGLPRVSDAAIAARLSSHLVTVAVAVRSRADVTQFFAEGGATAVELARRMGWWRLSVSREWQQGVVTLTANNGKSFLTMKPGSYVWPEVICRGRN